MLKLGVHTNNVKRSMLFFLVGSNNSESLSSYMELLVMKQSQTDTDASV